MTDPLWYEVLRALEARKLNRRRLMQASAAATAAATLPLARDLAAPQVASAAPRAQSNANQLVVLDSLQTQNWLYMDPGKFYEINPSAALNLLYESLYHIPDGSKIGDIKPLLAEDMPSYSSDGLTATIKIRQGVKFQNSGNPMSADDWVWSWNRLNNLKGNPSFLFSDFLDSVKAVDPATIEIKLKSPNAALPAILSAQMMGVMDSKVGMANGGDAEVGADQKDKLTDWINKGNSLGTGPYRLTQWDISGEVILEKNADYWGDAPKFDRVIFRNVADTSTQLQLLETGEADIAFAVDPDKISEVQSNPGLQLLENPSLAIEYVAMHTHPDVGGPLAKKEARQAVAHAIDYDGIITGLLGGHAQRPATIAPLGLLATEDVKDKAYTTDLAKANELWKTAGGGTTELSLTYGAGQLTPAGLSRDVLAPKLQQDLQKIDGVTVKLVPMDSNERLQMYRDGKLQFTMSDWSPDYDDIHTYCDPFGHTGGAAAKRVGYSDPAVDKLLTEGIAELDPAKRKDIYIKIQEALIDAAAFLVEFQPNYLSPASKALKGAQPHGIYILQLRYASKQA